MKNSLTEQQKYFLREGWYVGEDFNRPEQFEQWVKDSEARLAAEAPDDWISVDERLPEIDQYVLWHTHDYNYFIEALDKDGNEWLKLASHWKPIEPPKDK